MVDFINSTVAELGRWNPLWAYLLLTVSAFLENLIPPVPGDVVVIFSAYLVGLGVLEWIPVYVSTCIGGTLGFSVMFVLGARHGARILQSRLRIGSAQSLERAARWLERYGVWLVLANRFLSGIRSVIALSAGMGGMGWKPVVGLGLVSMAVWNGLLIYAGMLVGTNWERAAELLGDYNRIVFAVIATVLAVVLFRAWRRWRHIDSKQGPH